jgi:2Fe-2S ferredoxin
MKVAFILDGERKTVEFDPAALQYQRHGQPGSLLDIALNFAIPLEHVCGGNAACTTCHVIVRQGMSNLSDIEDEEADRLDTAWDVTPDSRLACQAVVKGDIVCEVPAYTRNYVTEGGAMERGKRKV